MGKRQNGQSQRAQCAAEVAKMREGRPSKETSQTCLVSIDDAAKVFSVSPSSVKTAKHVADKGDKAVVDQVVTARAVNNGNMLFVSDAVGQFRCGYR